MAVTLDLELCPTGSRIGATVTIASSEASEMAGNSLCNGFGPLLVTPSR